MIVMMDSDGTSDVLTLTGTLVAPPGTTISAGGCADGLFDQTDTVAPPAGAGLVRVMVPEMVAPPAADGELKIID